MVTEIIIILLVINVITFLTYGIDKWKAKHGKCGSIGAWLGMKAWHHKTMLPKFKYGVPAIFFIEMAVALYLAHFR